MKKILIGLLVFSSTALFAQENRDNNNQNRDNQNRDHRENVPTNVQQVFQRENPGAQNTQWSNTNGQWHGTYKDQNNRNVETYYSSDGHRVDTHTRYDRNDLPASVKTRADKKYSSNYETYRIDRPNSESLYQIKPQSGRTRYLDKNGKKRRYKDRH